MIFSEQNTEDCLGCYLAHTLHAEAVKIKKGACLNTEQLKLIEQAGVHSLMVARLDSHDVHEDAAAQQLAQALLGTGVHLSAVRTGRVNLHATETGLCYFTPELIHGINSVCEGITVATVAENLWVHAGKLIATVKIIPYAVPRSDLEAVISLLNNDTSHKLNVIAAQPRSAHLIQTTLNTTSNSLLEKTAQVTEQRLKLRKVSMLTDDRCMHTVDSLTQLLQQRVSSIQSAQVEQQPSWILIAGASAISDRNDVIPCAILAVGGQLILYGLPVDPGNLLLLGQIGSTMVIGIPGCARSKKYNGLDLVLDRLACHLPLDQAWFNRLSVGGLMNEIHERPTPRIKPQANQSVAAILLAAGQSTRFGKENKLLQHIKGKAIVTLALESVLRAPVEHVFAVTGHEQQPITEALQQEATIRHNEHQLTFIHNPHFSTGMGSSLVAGISEALPRYAAVFICLGDMPDIPKHVFEHLLAAWQAHPGYLAYIPTVQAKWGNPVLITCELFDDLLNLNGDSGARKILLENKDRVFCVEVTTNAINQDIDTFNDLQHWVAR